VILYVEDDPISQKMIYKMLRHMGYDIIYAETGKEALQKIRRQRPILILMDYHLPGGMDGLEITRRLKDNSDYHDIPVVALTADESSRADFEEAGADAYLNKPIRRGVLLRTITQVLNSTPGTSSDGHFNDYMN
jgi:CheY-like chemotaxis protein